MNIINIWIIMNNKYELLHDKQIQYFSITRFTSSKILHSIFE